ncbi:Microtubule-Actin Cross-Linking Factor 1, Isoforms 1/2/3/5 [Manis pentadactyla]|nr:Microtubule-Actin Cross-Linking Factor 1, Isoforms 1/2/3/5 [Manis pentadactyla]
MWLSPLPSPAKDTDCQAQGLTGGRGAERQRGRAAGARGSRTVFLLRRPQASLVSRSQTGNVRGPRRQPPLGAPPPLPTPGGGRGSQVSPRGSVGELGRREKTLGEPGGSDPSGRRRRTQLGAGHFRTGARAPEEGAAARPRPRPSSLRSTPPGSRPGAALIRTLPQPGPGAAEPTARPSSEVGAKTRSGGLPRGGRCQGSGLGAAGAPLIRALPSAPGRAGARPPGVGPRPRGWAGPPTAAVAPERAAPAGGQRAEVRAAPQPGRRAGRRAQGRGGRAAGRGGGWDLGARQPRREGSGERRAPGRAWALSRPAPRRGCPGFRLEPRASWGAGCCCLVRACVSV